MLAACIGSHALVTGGHRVPVTSLLSCTAEVSPGANQAALCASPAVPINFHIGNMGVASNYPDTVDSVPPAMHGGNVDDRRIGKGATMYYPVQVRALHHRVRILASCLPVNPLYMRDGPACSREALHKHGEGCMVRGSLCTCMERGWRLSRLT